jgi:hypothetical protein
LKVARCAALLLVSLALVIAGCGGDDAGYAQPTGTRTMPAATRAAATPNGSSNTPAAQTPGAGQDEVTGIVGAVVSATNTIEINQLSGADVTQVEVTADTQIRRATGGTLTLAQLRPSDRIVASGTVDGEVLVATRITVQDVVPGGAPGG